MDATLIKKNIINFYEQKTQILSQYASVADLSEDAGGGGDMMDTFRYQVVQMNGRKVLGPPEDWIGPPPSTACELFIRRIPKDLSEQKLIRPFLRFGRVYEFRLPLDFNQENRGYAYVKYTNEEDATCAMTVLEHYYVGINQRLEILHSYEKSRLFVNNIPKHLDESEIEEKFREIFPSMQRISSRGKDNDNDSCREAQCIVPSNGNRGYVFVHFPTHADALEAKKSTTPGLIRLWDRDLKIVWANTEKEYANNNSNKTIFVRNVDLSINNRDIIELLVKHVPRTSIRKVSKVRTTAFFDFTSREAAEIILKQMQGTMLRGNKLDMEWAKPSDQKSLHNIRNTDFDAVLRLKCIANGWQIPITLFGTYYEMEDLQYGAIILRDSVGQTRAVYAMLQSRELVDIHARLCEVACVLIERLCCFPDYDYLFSVQRDSAHLLGMIVLRPNALQVFAAYGVPPHFTFDYHEICDLAWAVNFLASKGEEALLYAYQESFRVNTICTYLKNWSIGNRIFGTIMPKYRNKPPLPHNLNDTQVTLALCYASTGTNCSLSVRQHMAYPATQFYTGYKELPYNILQLMPSAISQSKYATSHVIKHIQFGGEQYYHPAQRIMTPPIWISVCSYKISIKQVQQGPPQLEVTRTT